MKVEQDDIYFSGLVTFKNVPREGISTLRPGDTTPNISGFSLVFASMDIVTITNFLGGSDGQMLRIIGDGSTKISDNSNIKTNTGANKLLSADKVYTFSYSNLLNVWYENA